MHKNIIEKKYVGIGTTVATPSDDLIQPALLIKRSLINTDFQNNSGLSIDLSCDTGVLSHDSSLIPDAKLELKNTDRTEGAEISILDFYVKNSGTITKKNSITSDGFILHSNTKNL